MSFKEKDHDLSDEFFSSFFSLEGVNAFYIYFIRLCSTTWAYLTRMLLDYFRKVQIIKIINYGVYLYLYKTNNFGQNSPKILQFDFYVL